MKTRTRVVFAVAAVTLLAALAQAKPNFTGEWKMNKEKSAYGQIPAPDSLVRTIQHDDPKITMETTQAGQAGEIKSKLAYTTDGKECTNTINGQEVKGTAKWDGDALVIQSKRQVQGMELTFHERWSLSEDGKALTIQNHITAPQGKFDITLVLDKQ